MHFDSKTKIQLKSIYLIENLETTAASNNKKHTLICLP